MSTKIAICTLNSDGKISECNEKSVKDLDKKKDMDEVSELWGKYKKEKTKQICGGGGTTSRTTDTAINTDSVDIIEQETNLNAKTSTEIVNFTKTLKEDGQNQEALNKLDKIDDIDSSKIPTDVKALTDKLGNEITRLMAAQEKTSLAPEQLNKLAMKLLKGTGSFADSPELQVTQEALGDADRQGDDAEEEIRLMKQKKEANKLKGSVPSAEAIAAVKKSDPDNPTQPKPRSKEAPTGGNRSRRRGGTKRRRRKSKRRKSKRRKSKRKKKSKRRKSRKKRSKRRRTKRRR